MTPMGLLPEGDVGKFAVITSTGQVIQTPLDHSSKDRTVTKTLMTMAEDGSITGTTQVDQTGYFELMSRWKIYSNLNKPVEEIIGNMLARFNESGSGVIQHPDPLDHDAAWVVKAQFQLDPVVNLPGVAALTFPVGLAQGRFQTLASIKAQSNSRFPQICGSSSHEEIISLKLPSSVRLKLGPADVELQTKTLSYQAKYESIDNAITVVRLFKANRNKSVCDKDDNIEWSQFTRVLQRDLRQQFFLE
jgi:hypothetical protein